MCDVGADTRFCILHFQRRLGLGVLLRLDLSSLPAPIKHVPGALNADAAYAVGKDAAEIDGAQREQRQAHVWYSFGACQSTFEFTFALLHLRQPNLRSRR